jgi:iron complex transport system substrate-binding protein
VDNPQRVAALIGSFADIWCLAGGKDSLVAAANDTWTSFDLGLGEDVANLGAIKEPNLEVLLASEPDLILASSSTAADVELLDTLEMAGLNVVYFEVSNFQEYRDMLDICTQITGQRDHYVQYGEELEKEIQRAVERADGSTPSVLYVRATGSGCKVKNSQGSVLGEMLADLGCVNIADSQTSLLESLSLEVILQEDPDFIFLVMQGSDQAAVEQVLNETLLSNPAWQSLTAVQEGRCHVMDEKLYNLKPNARWGEAYENLAEILYPDN